MTATLNAPSSTSCFVRIRRAPTVEPPADADRRRDDHPVCAGQLALFTSIQSARAGAGSTVSSGDSGGGRGPGRAGVAGHQASVAGHLAGVAGHETGLTTVA